jgi:hypothetical protein
LSNHAISSVFLAVADRKCCERCRGSRANEHPNDRQQALLPAGFKPLRRQNVRHFGA